MRRVDVAAQEEPECLKEQRSSGNNWYDLPGTCKQEVRQRLMQVQDGLCIYCERQLTTCHVEHLKSQAAHDSRTLDWENLSLSCENDFKSCGHQKGSNSIPILPQHFPSPYPFRVLLNGTIEPRSSSADLDRIIEIVNLNGNRPLDMNLRNLRKAFFEALLEQLIEPPHLHAQQALAMARSFWHQRGFPTTAVSVLEACGFLAKGEP